MEKEWGISERLPNAFVELITEHVEKEQRSRKSFLYIAEELGIYSTNLSRWLAGMGPLSHQDIQCLASRLGNGIYIVLGIHKPELYNYDKDIETV